MKHVKTVTVRKADEETTDPILDQIFGFILELVDIKGKED